MATSVKLSESRGEMRESGVGASYWRVLGRYGYDKADDVDGCKGG